MRLSRRVSVISILTATCIGSGYALSGLPNVNLMDVLIFVSGYCFGLVIGSTIAVLSWLVYGTINPFGFGGIHLPVVAVSEIVYALFGSLARRYGVFANPSRSSHYFSVSAAVMGFISTLLYDLFTNIACAYTWYAGSIATAIIVGVPFTIVHEASNFVIFLFCAIPISVAVNRFLSQEHG